MKTKLIFSTGSSDIEQWTDLPFIPRINEWLNVKDILKEDEIENIRTSSQLWSGIRGKIQSVEYRHDDNVFYVEIIVLCNEKIISI
jgi:hypothetical protein